MIYYRYSNAKEEEILIVDREKLKKLRKSKGLSIACVSKHLGFKSQQGYYYKETGVSEVTAVELGKLATLYGVSVESLYKDDDQQAS